MPTYSEIGAEFGKLSTSETPLWLSSSLRKKLFEMSEITGRPVVVYESNHRVRRVAEAAQMAEKDLEFFMDVLKGMKGDSLDLILNSHGGSPDAADMVGSYLRQKFQNIRVFVPVEAMSAATMLACGASSIVMAKHSFLGPIDLQLPFNTTDGIRFCAAQDVLDQYAQMRQDFTQDPKSFWEGPGGRYWPDSIIRCENALKYGKEVAERGLSEVMFRGEPDAEKRARGVAADLADHQKHRAHARRLSRTYLRQLGMKIENLEDDQVLQDLVLTIHHFCSHWFETLPGVAKMVQGSHGRVAFDLDEAFFRGELPDGTRRMIQRLLYELSRGPAERTDGTREEPSQPAPEPPPRRSRRG